MNPHNPAECLEIHPAAYGIMNYPTTQSSLLERVQNGEEVASMLIYPENTEYFEKLKATIKSLSLYVRTDEQLIEEYVLEGTELLARAICHETDHLDGRLYVDVAEYMYAPEDEEEERVSPRLRKYARRRDK